MQHMWLAGNIVIKIEDTDKTIIQIKHEVYKNGEATGNPYMGYLTNSDYPNQISVYAALVESYRLRGHKDVTFYPEDSPLARHGYISTSDAKNKHARVC